MAQNNYMLSLTDNRINRTELLTLYANMSECEILYHVLTLTFGEKGFTMVWHGESHGT